MGTAKPRPRLRAPTQAELVAEWDRVAAIRAAQLDEGRDLTYKHVLTPAILELLPPLVDRIIDIGCGVGRLTVELGSRSITSIGIDPSGESIRLARGIAKRSSNIAFHQTTLEEYSQQTDRQFDVALANMVLMNVSDLDEFTRNLTGIMSPGGHFVFSVTHPWFWPRYWGYESLAWFEYTKEIFVEAPFRVSLWETEMLTTHAHRPLAMYLAVFQRHQLRLDLLLEPMPRPEINALYPESWAFPRYLIGRLQYGPF